ncbi:ATP-dependent endonuclease [Cohnella sp. GbtcB17]|uniref:ATP-dependent nuclease n=1 Tax=Cohnella sp. GbtcB17 TaxID=2824762 RepID=UPI001C2FCF67|nr:AAA family ATPase [Cohnella sp. GbtcB17]
MYLDTLNITNWRKFGERANEQPGLSITFNANLNVIVGENDSGKTAIIDAIKLGLNTNSQDSLWIRETDFFNINKPIKIKYIFKGLSEDEEAYFFEWIYFKDGISHLRLLLEAEQTIDINKKSKISRTVTGGEEGREQALSDNVKQLLAVTYLKPLRDAELELSSGNKSRLAQILKNLNYFQKDSGAAKKEIEEILSKAFGDVQEIIDQPVLGKMSGIIDSFFEKNRRKTPRINPKTMKFEEALKKLELGLGDIGTGLGSSNLLFMAAELLLLSENTVGAKIALIEEIEAHIHPQSQLRLIKYFEKKSKDEGVQYILTSHSPILASSISLEHIILIYNNASFPMRSGLTCLEKDDYKFLERFLDATKSNMFFAQGIICVEGDAENLLIPTLAEVLNRPLYDYGVSIINVGNLAFKRYASIFLRKEEFKLNFPISIVTDLDLKPKAYYADEQLCYFEVDKKDIQEINKTLGSSLKNEILVGLYNNFENLIKKINKTIGTKLSLEKELEIESILVSKDTKKYGKFLTDRTELLNKNYFNEVEKTMVFLSSPWTLEFAIAESGISSLLQDSILEAQYKEEKNRKLRKNKWEKILDSEKRAVSIYQFMLDNEVSKTVVSQLLSAKILERKEELSKKIINDPKLSYLVKAILHVTGGE